jgi:hypothetical protein
LWFFADSCPTSGSRDALIACLSLGWNIYRDVVLKAKVDVSFAIVTLIHPSSPTKPQYLNLKVVNFGPGPVTVSMICAKNTSLWMRLRKRTKRAVITADYTNPLSAKLPAKIEVGDKIELLLPYDKDCFLRHPFTHVGVNDYYGRRHWAPKGELKKAYETWKKDFFGGT